MIGTGVAWAVIVLVQYVSYVNEWLLLSPVPLSTMLMSGSYCLLSQL